MIRPSTLFNIFNDLVSWKYFIVISSWNDVSNVTILIRELRVKIVWA